MSARESTGHSIRGRRVEGIPILVIGTQQVAEFLRNLPSKAIFCTVENGDNHLHSILSWMWTECMFSSEKSSKARALSSPTSLIPLKGLSSRIAMPKCEQWNALVVRSERVATLSSLLKLVSVKSVT